MPASALNLRAAESGGVRYSRVRLAPFLPTIEDTSDPKAL